MNDQPVLLWTGEERLISDGFGSEWELCLRADCDLQIVRPGSVQCSGDRDTIGCIFGD